MYVPPPSQAHHYRVITPYKQRCEPIMSQRSPKEPPVGDLHGKRLVLEKPNLHAGLLGCS